MLTKTSLASIYRLTAWKIHRFASVTDGSGRLASSRATTRADKKVGRKREEVGGQWIVVRLWSILLVDRIATGGECLDSPRAVRWSLCPSPKNRTSKPRSVSATGCSGLASFDQSLRSLHPLLPPPFWYASTMSTRNSKSVRLNSSCNIFEIWMEKQKWPTSSSL